MKFLVFFSILIIFKLSHGAYIDFDTSIMNGEETQQHQFPFVVAIRSVMTGPLRRVRQCGGSLISRLAILSSGYCLYSMVETTVYLGAHTIEDPNEPHQLKIILTPASIRVHPGYVSNQFVNDIAIARLPTPIGFFNHAINLVYLPLNAAETFENEPAMIMGYGADGILNANTNRLIMTNVHTRSNGACDFTGSLLIQPTQMCSDGRGVCGGDDGGPLVIARNGNYLQVGIIQVASDGGIFSACRIGTKVYTRITSFLDWIEANI